MKKTYKHGFQVLIKVLKQPFYMIVVVGLYIPVSWVFVYLSNFGAFTHVLGLDSLTASEKLSFLFTSVANVFVHITDPLALSIVIFSFFATLNVAMIIYTFRSHRRVRTKGKGAAGVAIVGSHCVACAGSLLAPVVTSLSGSSAYVSAARADTATAIVLIINVIALLLIMHATLKLASMSAAKDGFHGKNQAAA